MHPSFTAVTLVGLLWLSTPACSEKAPGDAAPTVTSAGTTAPGTPTLQAEVSSCNLETQLKPGIPGSPGHLIASDSNPNGVSELASHMIAMRDDLARVRTELLAGGAPKTADDHYKIRCTWPTTKGERNPSFDAMSVNYLSTVDAFNSAKTPTPKHFNTMVQSCLACHANTCSGASVAIRPLLIQEAGKPPVESPKGMFE